MGFNSAFKGLTLILPTWTIWRAPTNASKWRMGFNSVFKGLSNKYLNSSILSSVNCLTLSASFFGISKFIYNICVWWSEKPKSNTVSGFVWFSLFITITSSNYLVRFAILAWATTVRMKSYISNFLTHLILHSLADILNSNHHKTFFIALSELKIKQSLYRNGQALRGPGGFEASQISRQSAHESDKVLSPMRWPPLPLRR